MLIAINWALQHLPVTCWRITWITKMYLKCTYSNSSHHPGDRQRVNLKVTMKVISTESSMVCSTGSYHKIWLVFQHGTSGFTVLKIVLVWSQEFITQLVLTDIYHTRERVPHPTHTQKSKITRIDIYAIYDMERVILGSVFKQYMILQSHSKPSVYLNFDKKSSWHFSVIMDKCMGRWTDISVIQKKQMGLIKSIYPWLSARLLMQWSYCSLALSHQYNTSVATDP